MAYSWKKTAGTIRRWFGRAGDADALAVQDAPLTTEGANHSGDADTGIDAGITWGDGEIATDHATSGEPQLSEEDAAVAVAEATDERQEQRFFFLDEETAAQATADDTAALPVADFESDGKAGFEPVVSLLADQARSAAEDAERGLADVERAFVELDEAVSEIGDAIAQIEQAVEPDAVEEPAAAEPEVVAESDEAQQFDGLAAVAQSLDAGAPAINLNTEDRGAEETYAVAPVAAVESQPQAKTNPDNGSEAKSNAAQGKAKDEPAHPWDHWRDEDEEADADEWFTSPAKLCGFLAEEAGKRADSASRAYERLARGLEEQARDARKSAKTAWSVSAAAAAVAVIGTSWSVYKASSAGQHMTGLREQANVQDAIERQTEALRADLERVRANHVQGELDAIKTRLDQALAASADRDKLKAELDGARRAQAEAEAELKQTRTRERSAAGPAPVFPGPATQPASPLSDARAIDAILNSYAGPSTTVTTTSTAVASGQTPARGDRWYLLLSGG